MLDAWVKQYVPSGLEYLDQYQQAALDIIVWDENSRTLKGRTPEQYMYDGFVEETLETLTPNDHSVSYHRFGALARGSDPTQPLAQAGIIDKKSVELHQKEFGDVSWYVANFLSCANVQFSQAVIMGLEADNIRARNLPKCNEQFHFEVAEVWPVAPYLGNIHEFDIAAKNFIAAKQEMQNPSDMAVRIGSKPHPTTVREAIDVAVTGGLLVNSIAKLVMATFDINYQTILDQNIEKLHGRAERGTIISDIGGDDR